MTRQITNQRSLPRTMLSAVAVAVLAGSLVACASEEADTVSPTAEGPANTAEAPADSSTRVDGLDCNWDTARLLIADSTAPSEQQGDLAETLVGDWQFTHYDLGLGDGWETWEDAEDRRYVYADTGDVLHCVMSSAGGSPSALGAIYTVEGDQITLDSGNAWTAVAWTSDALLLSNHFYDSLELHHRR